MNAPKCSGIPSYSKAKKRNLIQIIQIQVQVDNGANQQIYVRLEDMQLSQRGGHEIHIWFWAQLRFNW
jgi:hypothetical protein